MDKIEFDDEQLKVASEWHGGISSMLYAITSTGALSRGVERCRPSHFCETCKGERWIGTPSDGHYCTTCNGSSRGVPFTDDEWLAYLAEKLIEECEESAREARVRASRARHARRRDERNEMTMHAGIFDSMVAKCQDALKTLRGES